MNQEVKAERLSGILSELKQILNQEEQLEDIRIQLANLNLRENTAVTCSYMTVEDFIRTKDPFETTLLGGVFKSAFEDAVERRSRALNSGMGAVHVNGERKHVYRYSLMDEVSKDFMPGLSDD